jgi:hypothetical protein
MHLYEDLFELGRSPKLIRRVTEREAVLNSKNTRIGVNARRGDGTFGERLPHARAVVDPGFAVARGEIASIEVGVEVKILMKAMIKQIDRVMTDLREQAKNFRIGLGDPICVGIVGVNHAESVTSYEGDSRVYPTTGKAGYLHPIQEAEEAIVRLNSDVRSVFDEFLILSFRASNVEPFRFEWVDSRGTTNLYGAAVTRISREYERRF